MRLEILRSQASSINMMNRTLGSAGKAKAAIMPVSEMADMRKRNGRQGGRRFEDLAEETITA